MKMKKLQEIDRLVEEALNLLDFKDTNCWRDILTSFARKCAEINQEDWVSIAEGKFIDVNTEYNSRLRDGQVETPEQKQEEKPALQPLPEEVPEWFMHTSSKGIRTSIWNQLRYYYGTTPREWWHRLKKGDKFVFNNGAIREVKTFNGIIDKSSIKVYLGNEESEVRFVIDYCSPYTDPTQSFRSKLTPEMQVEFDKLVSSLTPNTPQP